MEKLTCEWTLNLYFTIPVINNHSHTTSIVNNIFRYDLFQSLKCQLEEEVRSDLPPIELEPLNLVRSLVQERDTVRLPVAAYRLAKRCLELDR